MSGELVQRGRCTMPLHALYLACTQCDSIADLDCSLRRCRLVTDPEAPLVMAWCTEEALAVSWKSANES